MSLAAINGQLKINLSYSPRDKFLPFHSRNERYAVLVAHRRCGKTFAALHDMFMRALSVNVDARPNPRYGFIAPQLKQAKNNVWTEMQDIAREIPGCIVRISDVSITLPNGAVIRLYGADGGNAESIRGSYFDGVIFDEFGDIKGSVYTSIVSPMLRDRRGWVVFMGTPKGKNNFYRQVQKAIGNPQRYFYLCLKASETGHLPEEELALEREDMEADEYEREYECSFEASVKGTYFNTQLLTLLNRTHQLDVAEPVKWDKDEPVELAMDIGRRDATAIDTFLAAGAPARKVPNPDKGNRVFHGIDIVRKALKRLPLRFDLARCYSGLEAIKNYRRKWDADQGVYSDQPIHDRWSHGADAFRYACQCINADTIQASVERAKERANEKQLSQSVINIKRLTLDEAFAAREREMERHSRNSGRAYD